MEHGFWEVLGPDLTRAGLEMAIYAGGSALAYGAYAFWQRHKGRIPDPWLPRTMGTHLLGMPGTGKTVRMMRWAAEMMRAGYGLLWIDPHGAHAEELLGLVPPERMDDVIYFNPLDEAPVGLNLLAGYDGTQAGWELIADDVIALYEDLYGLRSWGQNIEDNIKYATLAVTEWARRTKQAVTIIEPYRFLYDSNFRSEVLGGVNNLVIADFWLNFDRHSSLRNLQTSTSRLRRPLASTWLIECLAAPRGIDMQVVVDEGKILIANTGRALGPKNAQFLNGVLVSKITQAIMQRREPYRYFGLFLDEFHDYLRSTGDSLNQLVEQARKFQVCLFLAHQGLYQLDGRPAVREAVLLTQNKYVFKVRPFDARAVAAYLDAPDMGSVIQRITPEHLARLPRFRCLAVELQGTGTRTRIIRCPKPLIGDPRVAEEVKRRSRERYGTLRREIQKEIRRRFDYVDPEGLDGAEDVGGAAVSTHAPDPAVVLPASYSPGYPAAAKGHGAGRARSRQTA